MRGELVLGGRPCDQAYFSDPIPYRSGVLVTRFVVGPVISLALQGAVANQRARAQPTIGPSRGSEISAHHALPSLQVCLCKQFCKRVLHVSHDITLHGSVGSVLCAGGHRGRGVWCVSCVVVWGSRPPLRLLFSGVTRNFKALNLILTTMTRRRALRHKTKRAFRFESVSCIVRCVGSMSSIGSMSMTEYPYIES